MHFGIFLEERRRDTSDAAAFKDTLDLASFIAARTRRIRVGTAVQVLPLGNPLRIAEEVATVDQLSQGRFDFGVGRSGSPRAYDVLGVPYAESQARFEESLQILREAWKGEPFSYHGKFYRFERATVAPRPCQQPHPPIRMAANSPETFAVVARLGLQLFVGLRDLSIPELPRHLAAYRAAWREARHSGHGDVCVRIPVYAAPTEREALEEPRENMTYFFRRHAELTRSGLGRADTGPAERRQAKAEEIANLSYADILRTRVAFGSAAGLKERLARLRDELGLDGIVAELNPGGLLPVERMQRTLRILTHEVMPALA